MAKATKTLNPLHFEDLEPHRFEDLVRQLAYDFRNWRLLEPTGRLGSDEGYDARGFEIVDNSEPQDTEDDELENEKEEKISPDRLWQIQCKREKTITPSKIEKYIDEMIPRGADIPYGVIFASPCDFSKETRDVFREKLTKKGVQEFYMWSKADLEDMLMLPKNDHLLFAYFGISLTIRRRTIKSQIRALLSIKKKADKHLGAILQRSYNPVLVRDVNDKQYPYMSNVKDFKKKPAWKKYFFVGHSHDGIRLLTRKYFAYRDVDKTTGKLNKWDYSEEINLAIVYDDEWHKNKEDGEINYRGYQFSQKIDKDNRAFFLTEAIIPYDRIVEIDPLGDTIAKCPHIFVEVKNNSWFEYGDTYLTPDNDFEQWFPIYDEHKKIRVKYFPKKFPKVPERKPLPSMSAKKADDKEQKSEVK